MRTPAELPVTMPSHHFASLCSSSTQPWLCGSSPSRSGLYRHGALQPTAVLFTRNSYPRNSMPPQFQPYQCSAVAPADHCVTVRARPSHCRSDHLMAPAFRLISGPGCALADLSRVLLYICSPMQIEAVAQRPVSKLPSPMPSHRPASRFAAVRISAFRQHCHRYPHQRDTQLRTSNAPFTSALAIIANLSNAISLPFKSTQRPRQS